MPSEPITMIPDGWAPSTSSYPYLNQLASLLAFDANIVAQLTNFISSNSSAMIDDVLRASSIVQLKNDFAKAENLYNEVTNMFTISGTNFSSGDVINDSLNMGDDILTRAENIINKYDQLENFATDVMNHIEGSIEELSQVPEKAIEMVNQYKEQITNAIDNFSEQLSDLVDFDLNDTMNNLPDMISSKLLDNIVINDAMIMLNDIQSAVISVTTSMVSLKAPTSVSNVKDMITTLREVIASIRNVKSQYDRFKRTIENLMNVVTSGNYINLAMSLAAGGITFFEQPPTYAAKYPHNAGYRTHGGHVHEEDNTPGKERKVYTHPSGSGIEIHPNGTMSAKSKKDTQLRTDGYGDVYIGSDLTITVKGTARIIAETAKLETSGNTQLSTTGNCTISSTGSTNVIATNNVNVQAAGTAIVNGAAGVEVSTPGVLTLSGNVGVDIISGGYITATCAGMHDTFVGGVQSETVMGKKETTVLGMCDVTVGGKYGVTVGGVASIIAGGTLGLTSPLIRLN